MVMVAALDLSDVPLVSPEHLALPMQYMIGAGRGLAMLRGASDIELRDAESAVWDQIDACARTRTAVLLRFRCLIGVFAAVRLRRMLLQRGFGLLAPALKVAAEMRLNTHWGFNPLKFALALEALLTELDERKAARRVPRAVMAQAAMAQAAMAEAVMAEAAVA
jgi:hypothetical protein